MLYLYLLGIGLLHASQDFFASAGNAYAPALLHEYSGYFLSDA
jgi:hypothetical protein